MTKDYTIHRYIDKITLVVMPKPYHTPVDDISPRPMTDKCIILDLDETLVHTQEEMTELHKLKILSDPKLLALRKRTYLLRLEDLEKPGYGTSYDLWGVVRPHVPEFLLFCFSYFKVVAVWSAGARPYVDAVVDHLFKDLPRPHVVFTRDDVLFDKNKQVEKPLQKMMEYHPILREHMSHANTFVLDDNHGTFVYNPKNGVHIPRYEPEATVHALMKDDDTVLKFRDWLLQPDIMQAVDVTTLPKHDIFYKYPPGISIPQNIGSNLDSYVIYPPDTL